MQVKNIIQDMRVRAEEAAHFNWLWVPEPEQFLEIVKYIEYLEKNHQ